MSEDKVPSVWDMQMEMNKMTNDRVDLLLKWNQELTEIVKTISERLVALEGGCDCKDGEM
jgi:hypothetical protein